MSLPLVHLQDVDVALEGTTLLRGVSWQLRPGENWAVLGTNGAGKSTFLRLVRGEIGPAPGYGRRRYALDGVIQSTAVGVVQAMPIVSPETQARCLQLDWSRSVRQLVESGVDGGDYCFRRLTSSERERVQRSLRLLGIEPLARRNVQQLSTGELRRTLIARALAGRPRVLVLDEVCDGLDAAARADVLTALERIARNGTQILYSTHRDEEFIPSLTHQLVLERGRIRSSGTRPRVSQQTGIGAQAVPARSGWTRPRVSHLSRRLCDAGRGARGTERALVQGPLPCIRIRQTSVFLGGRRVLRNIDWEWRPGEHWAVLGPNGSGKSTFLKLIAGDVHPALGGVVERFEFTSRHTLWDIRRRIGFVSPELQAVYRQDLSGAEVIASGFHSSVGLMERATPPQLRRATALAKRLGFGPLAERRALALSYGEFRKLLLARALVHAPRLLLLDEPFDGLDASSRRVMTAVLAEVARHATGLVVVTHHLGDLPACINRIVRLESGRMVTGTTP